MKYFMILVHVALAALAGLLPVADLVGLMMLVSIWHFQPVFGSADDFGMGMLGIAATALSLPIGILVSVFIYACLS